MKNRIPKVLLTLALVCGLTAQADIIRTAEVLQVDAALDRPVVPANQAEDVVVQIKILPSDLPNDRERPPVNLSLVLDRSGSMSGEKIEQAIQAAEVAVGRLGPHDRVSVIIYDHDVETLVSSQHVTPEGLRAMKRALRQVTARGNTAIYAGLSQAAAELRRHREDGYINRMILLSDGLANRGPSQVVDFRALGRALAGEDMVISTIGLGLGFNEDIMTTLAEAGQGNTYFVENADDLPRIFAGELGDALNVAATNIEIIVRPRGGARIIKSLGREAELNDGSARFRMPQVYSGLEKLALVEVRVPKGVVGAVEDLIEVEVNYTAVGESHARSQQVSVPIRYTDEVEQVVAAARKDIAQNVVENRVAEAKEAAIVYADAGDRDEASKRLRSVAGQISADYGFLGDDFVAAPSAVMESEADEVQTKGFSNEKRKSYRADSYQSRNQQSVQ
ncbi:VWA domain-containing protein [Coraliomargarita sp. SDUM461004]|uniref:VWA domain-containing protein n=1 Tax=Thalassobacterium sedimentorum TaxID=3041258 RepID=A0ABU1AJF5_9BACT|nr:VWA domain-containing protein [Coraliomargarita sp. SDUM461004]MDQ8193990.1 VWA domain-containing protein [Coraliomargarita sp. SDUM461004]